MRQTRIVAPKIVKTVKITKIVTGSTSVQGNLMGLEGKFEHVTPTAFSTRLNSNTAVRS